MTARRAPARTSTRKAPARTGRGSSGRGGSRNSATLNVTGFKLGSLITFNFGGGRGRRGRGGGLFSRLRKTATSTLSALKGADYTRSIRSAATGPSAGAGGRAGGGGFDRFRASRPDLFDADPDDADGLTDGEAGDGDPDTEDDERPGGDR